MKRDTQQREQGGDSPILKETKYKYRYNEYNEYMYCNPRMKNAMHIEKTMQNVFQQVYNGICFSLIFTVYLVFFWRVKQRIY